MTRTRLTRSKIRYINEVVGLDLDAPPHGYQMKLQLLPELIMTRTKLPCFSLLLLLQVTFSVQLFQENQEATSLENVWHNFLSDDLVIKRFYVVVSLQVKINHNSNNPETSVHFITVSVPLCRLVGSTRDVEIFQSQRWHQVVWRQTVWLCSGGPNWSGKCRNKYWLCMCRADINRVKVTLSLSFSGHRINFPFPLPNSTWESFSQHCKERSYLHIQY